MLETNRPHLPAPTGAAEAKGHPDQKLEAEPGPGPGPPGSLSLPEAHVRCPQS